LSTEKFAVVLKLEKEINASWGINGRGRPVFLKNLVEASKDMFIGWEIKDPKENQGEPEIGGHVEDMSDVVDMNDIIQDQQFRK